MKSKNKIPSRRFLTPSNIPIKELYSWEDLEGFDPKRMLGKPGEFPFTRGVYENMYRGKLWTMRQYAGYGSAKDTNQRFKYLLSMGQTGLSVAFDLPTQLGLDSDHPIAEGEVGRTGVAISTVDDLKVVFDGIDLSKVSTSMTINATAAILLAMYIVIAEEQGIRRSELRGTLQNDPLKEFAARGNYIYPVKPSMRLTGDIIEFCSKEMPHFNPISISGYHYREAGANAVEEVAFTLSDALAYVEEVKKRGVSVDDFAPRLSFFFAAHINFFEEIAKFRAARRIWAKIMRDRFKAKEKKALRLRFHTQTAGSTLTEQEPLNNIVRVTIQALAAVLGGTQSLHTNAYDEAISIPTEDAAKIALRTQQIIAFESGVPDTVDPLGGSYFIENLTNEIEKRIMSLMKQIDDMGGAVGAVERGYFQKLIEESSYRFQREVEKGERVVVGVNALKGHEDMKIPKFLNIDPEVQKRQIERLKNFKSSRDMNMVIKALDRLKKAASSEENLVPFIIEAVRSKATLGEISDALREVWGTYKPGEGI